MSPHLWYLGEDISLYVYLYCFNIILYIPVFTAFRVLTLFDLSVCVVQMFEQCSCVAGGNLTAHVGQCRHRESCQRVFPYFLALSVITSFIISLGGTPGYMLLIRLARLWVSHVESLWSHCDSETVSVSRLCADVITFLCTLDASSRS